MHDRLVVVGRVLISDVVIVVFVEVMLQSCRKFRLIQSLLHTVGYYLCG